MSRNAHDFDGATPIDHRDPDLCGKECAKCGVVMCCLCDTGPLLCQWCQFSLDNLT